MGFRHSQIKDIKLYRVIALSIFCFSWFLFCPMSYFPQMVTRFSHPTLDWDHQFGRTELPVSQQWKPTFQGWLLYIHPVSSANCTAREQAMSSPGMCLWDMLDPTQSRSYGCVQLWGWRKIFPSNFRALFSYENGIRHQCSLQAIS